MTIMSPLAAATVQHLSRFAPFDVMAEADLAWLASRLTLAYHASGEVVMAPADGVAKQVFIIKQGRVLGESVDAGAWLELHEGEVFPIGAVLSGRPVISTFRAQGDVFAYAVSAEDFHTLLQRSPPFSLFCTERIANLLDQSQRSVQATYAALSSEQQSLQSPLSSLIRRPPVTCRPETPLAEALQVIQAQHISAIVVVDAAMHPVGVFSVRDLIGRVILPGVPLTTPMQAVMTPAPMTLPQGALAFEAAMVMAKEGFRHVLVVDQGRLVGVISEQDLFSLQRVGVTQLSTAIRAATSVASLTPFAEEIRQLGHNMLAQGVGAEQLTQIISTLNDVLTQRVIEIACGAGYPYRFCWLAFGSEGRLEQTLTTDQDNGIIFTPHEGVAVETVRTQLLALAQRINLALDACGFPLCQGQIMASNPRWCLTLDEWKQTFAAWIDSGTPDALLNASIFFDLRPIFGVNDWAEDLRAWLQAHARKSPRFLRQMVINALRNRPPLGVVRDFVVAAATTGHPHTLDLKLNGATPFVDAARIFSLAIGSGVTGTAARLRASAEALKIPVAEVEAWVAAFFFLQLLRLRRQHEESLAGETMDNHIDPDGLNELDRRILKEAFRQARKMQSRLALDYQI
jgi:CBS domain-containing protein